MMPGSNYSSTLLVTKFRIVQMDMVRHIPSQLITGRYLSLISYNGQLATCEGIGHMLEDCLRRTAHQATLRLSDRPTW